MVCEHLARAESALAANGYRETYRGQAWSDNCREWVYFDAELPLERLAGLYDEGVVSVHVNDDPRSGTELGLVCRLHHDGIMGHLPATYGR